MRARSRWTVLLAAIALLVPSLAAPASAAPPAPAYPYTQKALFFASDGMRPDLMEQYAGAGYMPTYASLMASGVRGDNGMNQGFPPNTGVGWYTMMTGTWPGEHGSTNNTYHRTGEGNFNNRTSFSASGTLQADTLAASAERAGKKVAQIDWVGGVASAINGPTVDFTNFFSTRGVLAAPLSTTEQDGAAAFGISYQVAAFAAASGWTNAPVGDDISAPPQQTTLTVATTFSVQNPTRVYDVYVYDSVIDGTPAYDTVLLVRLGAAKNASQASANLGVGDFEEVKLTGADGLIGARAGQTAGFYTKLISLAPDLSSFKIYFTSVQRVIATCSTSACAGLSGGLEGYLADHFPTYIAADFAPLEARIIDEDTYVEQGLDLHKAYADAVLYYILHDLQPNTDLAFTGFPVTDEFSHQFMGLVTPTDMDGNANPYYDDLEGNGTPDGRLATREGYIRSAYEGADEALALSRSLMGGNPTTFAGSDHGFAPQWYAVNVSKALADLGYGPEQASNCRAVAATLVKECHAGGTVQLYIDLAGRDPATFPCTPGPTCSNAPQVSAANYAAVRADLVNYFTNLTDPAHPGARVVDRVMLKEELRNVDGSDSLHPNRSGDVVVVFRPPYQTDAATPGSLFAFSQFFGQHGYLPNLVDIPHNVNMHATFVASGAGIKHQDTPVAGVRAIDLAPTLAFLLGVPGPQNARGRIMFNLLPNSGSVKEVTILDISDFHGQLIPLSEAADTLSGGGSSNPNFSIGGAAFLKPWFDAYRAEAPNGSLTVAGGDSVGATPPISAFFGDTPTIEAMNSMGFGLDGLGNHNFDVNSAYLRNTLIPLANFPYVSANVVDSGGNTPAEWSKYKIFDTTFGGVKVGIIGFTNDDAPTLVSPNAFDPFHVADALTSVNAQAVALKAKKVNVIVAVGHLGATSGTMNNPTGPLATFADGLTGVDAVVGDHTDLQILARRPNGVLVTENRSKGIRFTRIRLVVNTSTKKVIYSTADFHKPWDIGVTADPTIKAQIDGLNAILFPILSVQVGNSTKFIPRTDQCGNTAGRSCESLIGNVIAEAQRAKYGTDFGLANTGGIRADLTCPTSDNAFDFCAAGLYPIPNGGLYPITVGQVLTVLPFNNVAATLTVNGAELKTMLENGVSAMPGINGKFPQVAGLCFTYDIALTVGSRVTSAVRADALGNCSATPVDLTAGSSYTITMNDFTVNGGDGYPNFLARATLHTLDPLDEVVEDWITANTPFTPFVKAYPDGRINCADSNGATAPNCPTLVPSYP